MPYLFNEDGSGFYELEDSSGFLEAEPSMDAPFIAAATTVFDPTLLNPHLPTYVGLNSFGSISAVSAPYPTGLVAGDILLLFVETADEACATPSGWLKIGEVSNTGQTRLTVFMHRWVSGTAVTVSDSGDHQIGYIIAVRGASAKLPIFTTDSGTETGAGQTQSMDGPTTTVNNCFVVIATSHNLDVSTSTTYSAWTNANLASVTERADGSSIAGNGGGMGITTATLAVAGAVGTSTVVNSLTSPAWTSMVIAFAPPTPPPNDLFSNAEPLSDGLTQAVAGTTYDATTETGEDITALFGASLDRTQWWSYDATMRQIVKYRMVTPGGQIGDLGSHRGASVSTTSKYSIPAGATSGTTAGFGQEAERGLLYEYLLSQVSGSGTYNRAQVDPDYPLLLQSGRRVNVGIADFTYDIEFESFTPPVNDDFDDAEEITFPTLDPVDIVYDLEPATSQPGFLGISYVRSAGDLWYHINLATTTPVGIGIIKNNIADNAYNITAVIWQGTTLGTLTLNGTIRGTYFDTADNTLAQRNFIAGQDYYIQLLHDAAATNATPADTGTLRLQPYAIPANDNFADAIDLGTADSGFTTTATALGSSVETGEPSASGYSVWYEFTPTIGGWYEFDVSTAPATGWSLNAFRGVAVNALTWVSGLSFQMHNPRILALRGGETYHLQLGGVSWDFGQLTWDRIAAVPSNDDIANATVITGASGSEPTDIEGATGEDGELNNNYYIDQEVTTWFEWVCPSTNYYSFETTSLGTDEYSRAITVWETDTTGDALVGNLDGKDFDKGKLAFLATAAETYYIRVTIGRQYPGYTFDAPYSFDLDWDTFVPATDNLFANITPIAADPTGSLDLNNYGLPVELEVDFPPEVLENFQYEEFGTGYGELGRARWFDFIPEYSATYDFDITAPGSQVLMHMFMGDELDELLPVVDAGGGSYDFAMTYADHTDISSAFQVELVEGQSYKIVVTSFSWEEPGDVPLYWLPQGDFTLTWAPTTAENDNFSQMVFDNNNIGVLNYVFDFQYPGYEGVYGYSEASAGCRTIANFGATSQVGEPAVNGFGPVRTLWFLMRIAGCDDYTTDQGDWRIWIEPSGTFPLLDPVMAVYDYNGGSNVANPGTLLDSDDDTNGLYPEVILNNRFAYDTVAIQVDGRDEGEFTIHWARIPPGSPPANDDFADAIEIFDSVPFAVNAVHATVECGELPIAGFADGPFGSVWYKFLPTLNQSAQIVINNDWPGSMNLDYLYVDIYQGTTLENLVNITPADDYYNGAFNEILTPPIPFNVEAGETYYFRFQAWGDQAWSGATATMSAFGDDVYAPFISPATTLYTPSLLRQLPFIAPTTTLFAHYLSGAMDIPAPFIDLTGSAFTPYLVTSNRARLSQEAVEVLLFPDTAKGRVSQVAVEVLLFVDTAKARMSQEAIEVIFLPASAEIEARLTQLPVEVIKRVLHESVAITIID